MVFVIIIQCRFLNSHIEKRIKTNKMHNAVLTTFKLIK